MEENEQLSSTLEEVGTIVSVPEATEGQKKQREALLSRIGILLGSLLLGVSMMVGPKEAEEPNHFTTVYQVEVREQYGEGEYGKWQRMDDYVVGASKARIDSPTKRYIPVMVFDSNVYVVGKPIDSDVVRHILVSVISINEHFTPIY